MGSSLSGRMTPTPGPAADASPIVIIAGPTASGKTGLSLDAAETFGGAVVNADSMQVYRDLDILSARPTAAEMSRAPHYLFGVLPATDRCSAGAWLRMAADAVAEIRQRGMLPVVSGGTGLYLKALTQGLAPVPKVPDEIVDDLRHRFDEIGGEAFRDELARVDPAAAARLPAADGQRLIRAMAVARATGEPLSDWQERQPPGPGIPGRYLTIILAPPRDELYAVIDDRFERMMAAGALDEARTFRALGVDPSLPAARAVGLAELLSHLDGAYDLPTAVEKAKTATRNLAKRQETWFRRQIHSDLIISEKFSERNIEKIFPFIRQFVLTPPE